jgi:DNA-binding transcriptional ArsR family regulator
LPGFRRATNNRAEPMDRTFAALADPTRRALLATLTAGPDTVGNLAAPLPISLMVVIKHLGVLDRPEASCAAQPIQTVLRLQNSRMPWAESSRP